MFKRQNPSPISQNCQRTVAADNLGGQFRVRGTESMPNYYIFFGATTEKATRPTRRSTSASQPAGQSS